MTFLPSSIRSRAAAFRAVGLALLAALFWLATPVSLRALPAGEGPNGALNLEDSPSRDGGAAGDSAVSATKGRLTDTSSTVVLLKTLGSLAIVLALLMLAAYLLKRYGGRLTGAGPAGRADTIRIVSTKLLGGRRSLMLIRVRGQTLLLGVTPQAINCLTEIQELEGEWAQPAEGEGAVATPFERHLGRNLDRKVGPDGPGV